MDVHLQATEWLRTLGYDGNIPDDFKTICNHSTAFIWDQLMQNVRSRIEVQNIRNNILVQHLHNNGLSLNKMDTSQCNLIEINTYLKKEELKNDLEKINNSISEKQTINESLIRQNKLKSFSIEKSKLKIKENEEREYLLRQKLSLLEKDVQDAGNIYNFPMNPNVIVNYESVNSKDITEILQTCENKLEEKVQKLPAPIKQSSEETVNRWMMTAQKTAKKTNMFEKYLCFTEKQTSKKMKRYARSKENLPPNKINMCLFPDNDNMQIINKRNVSARRESLEMCMEENDDENFLIKLDVPKYTRYSINQTYRDETILNHTKCGLKQQPNISVEAVSDESVSKDIKDLISTCNRQSIWNIFRVLDDSLHFNISKKINFRNAQFANTKNRRQADLTTLQSLHVRTEFRIIKNNILIKTLTRRFNDRMVKMNESIRNSEYPSDIIESLTKNLQLQIEDVGLDCLLDVMKRELRTSENTSRITNSFELQKNLSDVKDKIALKRTSLIQYLEIMQDIFLAISRMRNTTSLCVRKLAAFTNDLSWCSMLQTKLNYQEMKVFEDFPSEHNRRFINTDPSLYYKDIHTNTFLCNREINDENLNKLIVILNNPFTMPETIILNILRTKLMLNALKSIKPIENNTRYNKHSLKHLQDKESYILNAIEQLHSLIASSTSKKTLSASNISQKVMDMWVEMPFTKYIPSNRVFDNKDYKTYEKEFDSFYNNL
ncbi:uncharacterized protein [Diabrotica undecimpunctata]|uniref:uncharacterized protein n=1 Tax=Diabrotica undecimpunctata TaxID=50387 RepID=UPI003B639BE2